MSTKMHRTIEELSAADIEVLTQLLCLNQQQPSDSWLQDQAALISTSFAPALLRPSSPLARLALHLPFMPPMAILCHAHKTLNPILIREVFLQISAECTTRTQRFKTRPSLSLEVEDFLSSIRSLNALWMSPQAYRTVVNWGKKEKGRFQRVENGCEACILARVGGDRRALVDLRASVLGRKRRRRPRPKLLPIIEGWIDWGGEGDLIRRVSDELGRELRNVKREIQRERKEARKKGEQCVKRITVQILGPPHIPTLENPYLEENEENIGEGLESEEEADFEGSIISFYRDAESTANLLSHSTVDPALSGESYIYPTFRDSVVFLPEATACRRRNSGLNRESFYSQSAYSRGSGFGAQDFHRTQSDTNHDRDSKTYRDLVGIPKCHVSLDGEEDIEDEEPMGFGFRSSRRPCPS